MVTLTPQADRATSATLPARCAAAVFTVAGIILSVSTPVFACEVELQSEIVELYAEKYHAQWGEQWPRNKVDAIIDKLAIEVAPMLGTGSDVNCSFSVEVERPPPQTSPFGPRLSKDARSMPVIFEFSSTVDIICIGLNDKYHRGLPPDKRFPHEVRRLPKEQLGLQYTYYSMKCFDRDGQSGRFIYN